MKDSAVLDNQSPGRRCGPRSPIPFPISFKTSGEAFERPARIRDMSARGIAFFSEHDLQPAARIEIVLLVPYEITLTEALTVRINADVIRIDDSPHARSIVVALSSAMGPGNDAVITSVGQGINP